MAKDTRSKSGKTPGGRSYTSSMVGPNRVTTVSGGAKTHTKVSYNSPVDGHSMGSDKFRKATVKGKTRQVPITKSFTKKKG